MGAVNFRTVLFIKMAYWIGWCTNYQCDTVPFLMNGYSYIEKKLETEIEIMYWKTRYFFNSISWESCSKHRLHCRSSTASYRDYQLYWEPSVVVWWLLSSQSLDCHIFFFSVWSVRASLGCIADLLRLLGLKIRLMALWATNLWSIMTLTILNEQYHFLTLSSPLKLFF